MLCYFFCFFLFSFPLFCFQMEKVKEFPQMVVTVEYMVCILLFFYIPYVNFGTNKSALFAAVILNHSLPRVCVSVSALQHSLGCKSLSFCPLSVSSSIFPAVNTFLPSLSKSVLRAVDVLSEKIDICLTQISCNGVNYRKTFRSFLHNV